MTNPVSEKPYAYEFGLSNGDGTFSIHIERYLPKNPTDWPVVKPLYAHPTNTIRDKAIDEAVERIMNIVAVRPEQGSPAERASYNKGITDATQAIKALNGGEEK